MPEEPTVNPETQVLPEVTQEDQPQSLRQILDAGPYEQEFVSIPQSQARHGSLWGIDHGEAWTPPTAQFPPPPPQQALGVRMDGTAIMPGDPDTKEWEVKNKTEPKVQTYPGMTNSEFRVVEDVVSMRNLLDSRKPGIRQRHCVININCEREDYLGVAKNSVGNIVAARVYTVQEVLDQRMEVSDSWRYALLNEEQLIKEPPQRKMKLEGCINPMLISLIKAAPRNEIVRGHIMAIFGQLPPPELETYDQIKDWCEFGFYAPKFDTAKIRQYGLNQNQSPPRRGGQTANEDHITVPVEAAETEIGTCNFQVKVGANYDVVIGGEILRNILDEVGTFSEKVGMLVNKIEELAMDQSPGLVWTGSPTTSEYDITDHEDYECDFSRAQVTDLLQGYIRRNYGPEEASQIING